jgi:hypothetical protein
MLGLVVCLALLQFGACASSPFDDANAIAAEETEWTQAPTEELVQVDNESSKPTSKKAPIYAMTCVQRKQEALRTLMNFKAAKKLKRAAKKFNVQDTKADWRMKQWHERYIAAASNYAFFCEQSTDENNRVSKTIHEKMGLEAQKAALRGLQDATYKKKEKEAKTRAKTKEKNTKDQAAAHEKKQKDLITKMADEARVERLHSLPQTSLDLMGFVADAMSGKGVIGVKIDSACPFATYSATTTELEQASGFSKYTIKKGVSGPKGYRCYLTYKKDGYIPLRYRILIAEKETQAIFRHSVLMPIRAKPPSYRIVLQYSNTPADIDAHLQVYNAGGSGLYDVSGHKGSQPGFSYTTVGAAEKYPFVTLDQNINDGYGPETHTIHTAQVGKYSYYVKNQDYHFTDNLQFHDSGARVFLYEGNELKHRFAIRNAVGNPTQFWQVFTLACTQPADQVTCKVEPLGAFVKEMPIRPELANLGTKI